MVDQAPLSVLEERSAWDSAPKEGGPDLGCDEAELLQDEQVPDWAGAEWSAWAGVPRKGSSGSTDRLQSCHGGGAAWQGSPGPSTSGVC